MAINYTGVDLDRYNAGNKFYSQDRYLQGTGLDKPAITFNPSRSNTGIMSQYPYPYPIIPQGDGGDGGGPIGPKGNSKFDYETEAYGLNNLTPEEKGITQEEQDLLDLSRRGYQPGFKDLGGFMMRNALLGTGFINFGLGANSLKNKEKAFQEDITNQMSDLQTQQDFDRAMASGQSFYDNLNDGQGSTAGGVGNTAAQAAESRANAGDAPGYSGPSTFQYGGRAGYRDGYSVQDDMTDYATNVGREASPGGGFQDSGGDGNNPPPTFYSTNELPSNLNFKMEKGRNPAFSYANNFGKFGGVLDTTRTIQEEEPVGNINYFSPSGNFGIGLDTKKGLAANYMFDDKAGRFGVNYDRDGLNLGLRFEKNFNNGGIVRLYR